MTDTTDNTVHLHDYAPAMLDLQDRIFGTAERAGWHDRERDIPECIALVHSELSEALESFRDGDEPTKVLYKRKVNLYDPATDRSHAILVETPQRFEITSDGTPTPNKVEGVAAELADAIIRILDFSQEKGIPVVRAMFEKMEYNETRPYRHGGKVI